MMPPGPYTVRPLCSSSFRPRGGMSKPNDSFCLCVSGGLQLLRTALATNHIDTKGTHNVCPLAVVWVWGRCPLHKPLGRSAHPSGAHGAHSQFGRGTLLVVWDWCLPLGSLPCPTRTQQPCWVLLSCFCQRPNRLKALAPKAHRHEVPTKPLSSFTKTLQHSKKVSQASFFFFLKFSFLFIYYSFT